MSVCLSVCMYVYTYKSMSGSVLLVAISLHNPSTALITKCVAQSNVSLLGVSDVSIFASVLIAAPFFGTLDTSQFIVLFCPRSFVGMGHCSFPRRS